MDRALQISLLIFAALIAAACWVLLSFFPVFPQSLIGWLAVFFVGVPVLLAGEYLVELIFRPQFLSSWPAWARIFYGLVAALALLTITAPVVVGVAGLIAD
jgi:hypothetical protein